MYRINLIACYKPWRYSSTLYTKDKEFFSALKEHDESMIYDIDWSLHTFPDENEDLDRYEILDQKCVNVEFPVTIEDEVTLYTE